MPETVEKKEEEIKGIESFSPENMFNSEAFINNQEEEDLEDIKDFDGVVSKNFEDEEIEKKEEEVAEKKEVEDDNKDDDGSLKFDEAEKETDENDIDLEKFNKKFNTDFKKEEELKDFIKSKEKEKEVSEEQVELETVENSINLLEPLLAISPEGKYLVNDETLMRKQFNAIAIQEGKDLNDPDVAQKIEDDLQELIDNNILKYEARDLRRTLTDVLQKAKDKKTSISTVQQQRKEAEIKSFKDEVQKEFLALHANENFYGVQPTKEKIMEAYKKVASGKFIESLSNDRKLIAELALMNEFKEQIFKKSTGLTYNDGMKAVIDEFKKGNKKNPIAGAQKRGTMGNKDKSQMGLIDSVLYEKPKEENK
jgi:hypothetical protein